MRKLVFAINVSADGNCEHTAFNPDKEMLDYFTRLTQETGVLLYGRKTFELMVPYWPNIAENSAGQSKADIAFAQAFISVPQIVVFSKTLGEPTQKNTKIFRSGLREEIQNLKQAPGKDILVGGVELSSELLALGLIDELRIVVHPVIAGLGRRIFEGAALPENLPLKLVDTTTFQSGGVVLHYLK